MDIFFNILAGIAYFALVGVVLIGGILVIYYGFRLIIAFIQGNIEGMIDFVRIVRGKPRKRRNRRP